MVTFYDLCHQLTHLIAMLHSQLLSAINHGLLALDLVPWFASHVCVSHALATGFSGSCVVGIWQSHRFPTSNCRCLDCSGLTRLINLIKSETQIMTYHDVIL